MSTDEYLSKLTQVLASVQSAGIHIAVNARSPEAVLNDARRAWYVLLKPEIPLDQLEATVLATIREKCDPERTGNASALRALAASDVLRHWRRERYQQAEKTRYNQIMGQKICQHCGGSKKITVYNPRIEENVVKDCPFHSK